jgi:hypothetical protein
VFKAFLTTAVLLFGIASPLAAGASTDSLAAGASTDSLAQPALQSVEHLTFFKTTNVHRISAARAPATIEPNGLEVRRTHIGHRGIDIHPAAAKAFARSAVAAASVPVPTVAGRSVTRPDATFSGFVGLSHFDQRLAGDGIYTNTQFSLEPPDQGLCVGNGLTLEVINNALTVTVSGGVPLIAPVPTNELFGLAPEIIRNPNPLLDVFGPSLSDPRCYFDRDTQRWFITEFEQDINPVTEAGEGRTALFIAISQTPDPTGSYNVLTLDTTDSNHPGCPCLPDQPLLGADANGIYLTTNEFSLLNGNPFHGTQLYALSKIALALDILPPVVHIDVGALPTPDIGDARWASLQPAESPDLHRGPQPLNGTEYFLSSLDFFNKTDNRIAVWALTNTATLWNNGPKLALHHVVIRSESYGEPDPAVQKAGPTPLADAQIPKAPLPLLDSGDDRMQQVVFAQGRLWAGLTTKVVVGGQPRSGIAVFVVKPSLAGGVLSACIAGQGYVAVAGQNTIYPSIGVNAQGRAILTCTLVGPGVFPSAAYVPLNTTGAAVRLAALGAGPDDGFTAYPPFSEEGVGRWGDYTAAVADEMGNIWFGAEYIPRAPRTQLANWGTFIGEIHNQ